MGIMTTKGRNTELNNIKMKLLEWNNCKLDEMIAINKLTMADIRQNNFLSGFNQQEYTGWARMGENITKEIRPIVPKNRVNKILT